MDSCIEHCFKSGRNVTISVKYSTSVKSNHTITIFCLLWDRSDTKNIPFESFRQRLIVASSPFSKGGDGALQLCGRKISKGTHWTNYTVKSCKPCNSSNFGFQWVDWAQLLYCPQRRQHCTIQRQNHSY
jgi:hypothetical protein